MRPVSLEDGFVKLHFDKVTQQAYIGDLGGSVYRVDLKEKRITGSVRVSSKHAIIDMFSVA